MWWCYVAVFGIGLGVDSIPVFAPPAWMLILPLVIKCRLNPWAATALGAVGSTFGRYALSLYMPKIAGRILNDRENANVKYLGGKLNGRFRSAFAFVLIYALTPLSTTALFTAAGAARINPLPILPAFLIGKFASDALMIVGGEHASADIKQLLRGEKSPKSLAAAAVSLLVIMAVMFVDWRALLEHKKLRFRFDVWRTKKKRS